MLSGALMITAKAIAFPNLPSTPVTVDVTSGINVYPLTIVLSGVPAGFDVTNKAYTGFCIDLLTTINPGQDYSAILISSLGLSTTWNKINYILNNQQGTAQDVQAAIWLVEGFTDAEILSNAGFDPSATADAMVTAANAHSGFTPGPGQIVAVWCDVTGGQDVLIELTIPTYGPGLTPGFWKHNVGVYLTAQGYGGLDVHGSYSDSGSPLATRENMATFLSQWSNAQLLIWYNDMNHQGGGSTWAAIRQNTANIFNAAAGLSTTVII